MTISPDLLGALDATLASGTYSDAGNTTFALAIADQDPIDDPHTTFTWDARNRLTPGRRGAPTCAVEFASVDAFCRLASQDLDFLELAATNQIRIGGLFDDVAAFARLFQRRMRIPDEPRLITLPTAVKRAACDDVMEQIASFDLTAQETLRAEAILSNFAEHRLDRCALDLIIEMDVPGLQLSPWMEPDAQMARVFDNSFGALRDEATRLLSGEITPPPYGGTLDAPDAPTGRPSGWRHWRLVSGCQTHPAACAATPIAASIVRQIAEQHLVVAAEYLVLEPGARIYPHADGLSWCTSVNCGLIVPDDCYLSVAGATRYHREGQVLVFNDGFIHSAGNESGRPRVLFNVMCAHPEFSRGEQAVLKTIMQTLLSKMQPVSR
jgi:Aspartyl/Asparaginyl beta-hydroxylase